jgi:hypothetical protein
MATAVDQALDEIDARLAVLEPQYEGLQDFARLNLHPDTRREIEQSIEQYDRRLAVLRVAKEALERLRADGHPDLDVREIVDSAFRDLQDNAATIQAALAQFSSGQAAGLRLSSGPAERKP